MLKFYDEVKRTRKGIKLTTYHRTVTNAVDVLLPKILDVSQFIQFYGHIFRLYYHMHFFCSYKHNFHRPKEATPGKRLRKYKGKVQPVNKKKVW